MEDLRRPQSVLDLLPSRICESGKNQVWLAIRKMWRANGVKHLTPAQVGELRGIVRQDLKEHQALRNNAVDTLSCLR